MKPRSDSCVTTRLRGWRLATAISLTLLAALPAIIAGQTVVDLRVSASEFLMHERGKVLVFVFVRTDCPISNRYAPLLQEMHKKNPEVHFHLVFPDRNESAEKIRTYLREYRYDVPAIRDGKHELVQRVQARVTPEAAVFDAKGRLVYHGRIDNLYERIGQSRRAATTHELADAIQAATAGTTPSSASADAVGCFIADME